MPKRFIHACRTAASELELSVTPWRVVLLPSSKCLVAELWIEGFGSPRGLLLFSSHEQLEGYAEELKRECWAHVVLAADHGSEPTHAHIMQHLRSWGWFGAVERMPSWLISV